MAESSPLGATVLVSGKGERSQEFELGYVRGASTKRNPERTGWRSHTQGSVTRVRAAVRPSQRAEPVGEAPFQPSMFSRFRSARNRGSDRSGSRTGSTRRSFASGEWERPACSM
jgi:hypothetical protein